MKKYIYYLMWLSFFSFLIFGMWEFLQTPFFDDNTDEINIIVYNRVHCTIGDILILLSSISVTSLIVKNMKWIFNPEIKHYIFVSAAGVIYTVFSEINNVYIIGGWAYSAFMPEIFGVGLLPLLQWLILPRAILYITARFMTSFKFPDKNTSA